MVAINSKNNNYYYIQIKSLKDNKSYKKYDYRKINMKVFVPYIKRAYDKIYK